MIAGDRASRLLKAVIRHADFVLRHAVDRAGGTPLFVNAVAAADGAPVRHDYDHVDRRALLASPASQQHWLRALAALSVLTGDPGYREAAEAVFRHLLQSCTDASGLIYWGGHTAFDLENRRFAFAPDKAKVHELKCHYPDYGLMWSADPEGTKRYVEAMWNAHILDWKKLDFNRHGPYGTPRGPVWKHVYAGGSVFFWGKGLTFVNAGSDLYYGAAMLAKLSGDSAPLVWAKRLAGRYVETRRDGIGISGYQFSQSANSWCAGPAVRGDRAQYQIAPLVPADRLVYESTLFKPVPAVVRCQLVIGETLGDEGAEFARWACEEMAAWGRVAYRRSDNRFTPMLTDGWPLEGLVLDRRGYFGPKGKTISAIPAGADFLWMYAMGYRSTGDPFLWRMARDIGRGIGIGDIGERDGEDADLAPERAPLAATAEECRIMYGLLELHRATGRPDLLDAAFRAAKRCLAAHEREGRFEGGGIVFTDDPAPLSLLHVAAVSIGVDLATAFR
ncbi:hypothetical protein ABEV74_20025 [Paenibacillus cisolokensis]|uniref:hypothetical protein n=1 Tax=Paenibacillus cisolokensis TaxID=1658519 RepID=UPI003D2A596D